MCRTICVVATAFLVALSAAAIVPPQGESPRLKSRPEWVRVPELGANPSLDRMERGDPRAVLFPGVGKLFGKHSGNWTVTWDTRSHRAHILQGPGVPWGQRHDEPVTDSVGRARAFMAENPELFDVDPADLVLDESRSGTFGKEGQLQFVTFQQTYKGIPVEDARVFFRVNRGQLRSFGTVRVADVHMSTHANVDKDEALLRVLDHAGFTAEEVTELLVDGELKIVPTLPPGEAPGERYLGAPGFGYRHTLVREVSFRREGDDATYEALVDARNGRILKLVDANAYATVTGAVVFDYGANDGPVLTFPSNTATSTCPGGVYPNTRLDGVNFLINDNCGPIDVCDSGDANSFNGQVDMGSSPGHDCSTPGFGGAGNTRAARSSFYHLTTVRNIADTYHPTNTWLDSTVTVNTNVNSSCSAYWNGSTVNVSRSGSGCGNPGEMPAAVLHEWAHGFDSSTGGPAPEQASGEALGDLFAALYTEDSCIASGFLSTPCYNCTTCTGVRDLNDFGLGGTATRATPANITSNTGINCDRYSCPYFGYVGVMGYQGHCESIIASSAVWNLAQDVGFDTTEQLWYDSITQGQSYAQIQDGGQCNPAATVNGCGAENWFTVMNDVDDGSNACAIWDAFDAQGIACGPRPVCGCFPPYHDELADISGTRGSWKYYSQDLQACATTLTIKISGGTGDADLYVRRDALPTAADWECRPYLNGNNETCTFPNPVTTSIYYVGIYGWFDYAGLLLEADYQ